MNNNAAADPVSRPPLPEPNPVTRAAHRREAFWQITLPFLAALLIILLLAGGSIWAAAGGLDEVSRWADISTVWLVGPMLIFLVIVLITLSAITFGIIKLIEILPRYTRIAQDFMLLVSLRVRNLADKAVAPLIRMHGYRASAEALRRIIRSLFKK